MASRLETCIGFPTTNALVQIVDKFVVMLMIGLAMLSALQPDWVEDRKSAWVQVCAMGFGLVAIGGYICFR